jgi:anaerobic magnesium-protoporphyrin IX monomethyl ester cyclase
MINIVNRTDNREGVAAAHSPVMRFWSPDFIIKEFDQLAQMGVQTLRISDEMFFLNQRYYEPLVKMLAERDYGLRMWTYSRVDTVREEYLPLFLKAGIQWLCLGIEAGNQTVRREVYKGSFKDINIREVVKSTRQRGMKILSNFIFGLPEDSLETMQQTLDLALELNTEHANFYPCQALPGSQLYYTARANGWKTPDSYAGYAFLSYECEPLPTKYCTAAQVLKFRDEAWQKYFTNPAYLAQVERLFGAEQRKNVEALARVKLRRKLLGDPPPPAVTNS